MFTYDHNTTTQRGRVQPSARRTRPVAAIERRLWQFCGAAFVGTTCGLFFGAMTF